MSHFVSLTKRYFPSYLQIVKCTTICPRWLFLKAERCKGDLDLLADGDTDVVGLVLNNHKCCNQNTIQDLKLDLIGGIVLRVVVRLYGSSFNWAVRCSALAFEATVVFVRARTKKMTMVVTVMLLPSAMMLLIQGRKPCTLA